MLAESDIQVLTQQMGRRPQGVVDVVVRDRARRPVVIQNHPLRQLATGWAAFPTLYWLTCPRWIKSLADLERCGAVGQLEQRIASDQTLGDAVTVDHRRYIEARWHLLTPDERQVVDDSGLTPALRERGIGGIADFQRVKCLHVHYAHHLAAQCDGGSAIGRLIDRMLGEEG